jgi:acetyl esterase/lipase
MESQFKIRAKRVFLSGDSAGGNLIFALMNLIIVTGQRRPDYIFPTYPAIILDNENFVPSLLLSIDDLVLSAEFLKICIDSYIYGSSKE